MKPRRIIAALAVALLIPLSVFAQEEEMPKRGQLYHVTTWEVQPDQMEDFEFVGKKIAEAAKTINMTPYRWVWYADASRYTLVGTVESFAEFDDPGAFWSEFMGTEAEALVQEAHATFVTVNARVLSDEVVERLGHRSYEVEGFDPASQTKYIHVDEVWPKPNMEEQFEEIDKKWVAIYKDVGSPYPYDTHSVHFGDSGRIVYVTFIDDLAKFYGENDFDALAEAAGMTERLGALFAEYLAVVDRFEHYNLMFKPEMSYWPAEELASN